MQNRPYSDKLMPCYLTPFIGEWPTVGTGQLKRKNTHKKRKGAIIRQKQSFNPIHHPIHGLMIVSYYFKAISEYVTSASFWEGYL